MRPAPKLRRLLASAALGLALSSAAMAEDRASLVADNLQIEGDSVLVAEGNVEVFFQGRRLTATRIVYDQSKGSIQIEGPLRLSDAEGAVVILASQADLDADLTEGLLSSARVVLDDQLQIAATEARRVGGRYMVLENTVASSCRVCGGETPLWEIRAKRVTQDQVERQLYFDHAQLRLGGVPVLYIPRLRMPDATLKRATGMLRPKVTNSSTLGTGIEVPYFFTLGRSRDLTVTPFATTKNARSLGLRYRQAYENGNLTINSALTRDEERDGLRGYLFADGSFALPYDYQLQFHGEMASDPDYLSNYDLSDADRLPSYVAVSRVSREELVFGKLRGIRSLRTNESDSTIPSLVGDALWQRRFAGLGGTGSLRFASHGHMRSSVSEADTDGDGVPDGRDVARATIAGDWQRDWLLPGGLVGAVMGEARVDFYDVSQDPLYAATSSRSWGALAGELRWPWVKSGEGGVTQVIEPVLQVVSAGASDANIPNEDSVLVEFDEASLFALSRYPGSDVVETGTHANLGLSWTRTDADGWSMGASLGRVFRMDGDENAFSEASGLGGLASDWLASVKFETANGFYATGRVIADDALDVARGEVQLRYATERMSLGSGYIWSIADAEEFRTLDVSEGVFSASYLVTPNWRATTSGRYDFETLGPSRAGLGLQFRNECLQLDLSLSHRFETSTSVKANTTVGLTLEFLGFGGGDGAGPARVCRG